MHFESRERENCSLGFIHTGSPDAFLTLAENDRFRSFQRKGLLPPPCAHMHKHSFAYEWGQGHSCQVDPKQPSPCSLKTHLSSGKEPSGTFSQVFRAPLPHPVDLLAPLSCLPSLSLSLCLSASGLRHNKSSLQSLPTFLNGKCWGHEPNAA